MTQGFATETRSSRVIRGTVIAIVASVVANIVVFLIGNVGDPTQIVMMGETAASDLPIAAVVASSVFPVILGGIGLWILQKVTADGFRLWVILVALFTVVSLAGPIALEVDTASKVVLSIMHFVVGGAAVVGQLIARGR